MSSVCFFGCIFVKKWHHGSPFPVLSAYLRLKCQNLQGRRVWVDDKRISVMGMSDGASLALSMVPRMRSRIGTSRFMRLRVSESGVSLSHKKHVKHGMLILKSPCRHDHIERLKHVETMQQVLADFFGRFHLW